jgi:hypothetical protein
MSNARDAAEEIKQLYYGTTKQTVARDLERAIALLISLESDEARERVAVYMDGLAQMRSEWGVTAAPQPATTPARPVARRAPRPR